MYNFAVLTFDGVPTNGTNEVETVTITGTPTGGTFTLTYGTETTATIAYNATAAEVQAALTALTGIGVGDVVCTGGALPGTAVSVSFEGALAGLNITPLTGSATGLTGGGSYAVVIATPTPGVRGTYRGAQNGALLCAKNAAGDGVIYENTGLRGRVVWTELAVTED